MRKTDIQPDCWKYGLPGGFEALAGKTDADNDLLSLKTAGANDLWFHVRGLPGSHVVLRHPEGEKPGNTTIKQAAAIAAWHSKARNAGTVPVNYTEAKHVGKPRGAKPGSVTIKREKTVKVRPALPEA
ncbi:MAG: NFACT RNA binding domain-containing protein [Verrucomicrobiota bacterium]